MDTLRLQPNRGQQGSAPVFVGVRLFEGRLGGGLLYLNKSCASYLLAASKYNSHYMLNFVINVILSKKYILVFYLKVNKVDRKQSSTMKIVIFVRFFQWQSHYLKTHKITLLTVYTYCINK